MFGAAMEFDLGEDVSALREQVHRWAQERVAPLAAEIDQSNQFPVHLWREMGDLGLLGLTVDEEFGGAGMSYLAHTVAARKRFCQLVLWRAFQPLREPDQAQRHPGTKGKIPPQADFGRACGRLGDVRA